MQQFFSDMKSRLLLSFLALLLLTLSCRENPKEGNVSIKIRHSVNGRLLVTDTLCYVNEAGNPFMVTEIQWFLSDIALQDDLGHWHAVRHQNATDVETEDIFYVDTNIEESQTLISESLPSGHYQALRFTFGLDEAHNQTGLFMNPPESNMFWPEPLGGGYHYMKLNGRFADPTGNLVPLNIHLGIGQDATGFIQNYFGVTKPVDFTLEEGTNDVFLTMVIDNWFRSPNVYDFNIYGPAIMQNQEAQALLKENGHDVFQISVP